MPNWYNRLFNRPHKSNQIDMTSYLRSMVSGSMYRVSDLRTNSAIADIRTQIDTMRALANDSQISTALSYYATDATTTNASGKIIWATADVNYQNVAEIVNQLFDRWNINAYARDHILELATVGNLYLPSTEMYRIDTSSRAGHKIALDQNTIADTTYDILPCYKIPPENILHLWYQGKAEGYVFQPDDTLATQVVRYPESAVIHFSLGGLLGDYTIDATTSDGEEKTFDIQFAKPLLSQAVQPTQTLSLLEDAAVLSSLARIVKFLNVECGNAEEEEIQLALQQIKEAVEQQLSLNTANGDTQSFVNPQSPNNLIYLPKINGADAISITDLNMAEASDADNKLLQYYQDKKLSVLGVPKEMMNFSSNEGLGGAGSVLSQRSAIYANALLRIENAYITGWKDALNKYFIARNMSGFVDKFELHMNPIITEMTSVQFERRDNSISQAQALVELLKALGVSDTSQYKQAITEAISQAFPDTGASANGWEINVANTEESENPMGGF